MQRRCMSDSTESLPYSGSASSSTSHVSPATLMKAHELGALQDTPFAKTPLSWAVYFTQSCYYSIAKRRVVRNAHFFLPDTMLYLTYSGTDQVCRRMPCMDGVSPT